MKWCLFIVGFTNYTQYRNLMVVSKIYVLSRKASGTCEIFNRNATAVTDLLFLYFYYRSKM